MQLPLSNRRAILASALTLGDHVGLSQVSERTAEQMLSFVRSHELEEWSPSVGQHVPTRQAIRSLDEDTDQPGPRVRDRRIHPSYLGVDSIVVGFYKGKNIYYAARVRADFVPATRRQVFDAIKHLKTSECPFVNLPRKDAGGWGQGFTAEKMKRPSG